MELTDIIEAVVKVSGINIKEDRRNRNLIILRNIYYKIAREYTPYSLDKIGFELGKGHATVLHHLKNVEFDLRIKLWNNIYQEVLNELQLDPDLTLAPNEIIKYVEKKVEYNNSDLPIYIVRHLKEYSDIQLSEVYETRLKPFKKALDSRIEPKIIIPVDGAKLNI